MIRNLRVVANTLSKLWWDVFRLLSELITSEDVTRLNIGKNSNGKKSKSLLSKMLYNSVYTVHINWEPKGKDLKIAKISHLSSFLSGPYSVANMTNRHILQIQMAERKQKRSPLGLQAV